MWSTCVPRTNRPALRHSAQYRLANPDPAHCGQVPSGGSPHSHRVFLKSTLNRLQRELYPRSVLLPRPYNLASDFACAGHAPLETSARHPGCEHGRGANTGIYILILDFQTASGREWHARRCEFLMRSVFSHKPALAASIITAPIARGSCVCAAPDSSNSRQQSSVVNFLLALSG